MTNEAWVRGMALMVSSLKDRDLAPEMADVRARAYREALDHLSDGEWRYATVEAVRTLDWFPSVKELLDLAGSKPVTNLGVSPGVLAALPEDLRNQYLETRKLNGDAVPRQLSPEEAAAAVKRIREQSGLDTPRRLDRAAE